jgi:hypothetical protein
MISLAWITGFDIELVEWYIGKIYERVGALTTSVSFYQLTLFLNCVILRERRKSYLHLDFRLKIVRGSSMHNQSQSE